MDEKSVKPDLSRLAIQREERKDPSTASGRTILYGGGAALFVLLGLLLYVFGGGESANSRDLQSTDGASAQSKMVNAATDNDGLAVLNATGYVVAQRQAAVSSKATGRLKELNVIEGDQIKQGDVIGVLENDDLVSLVKESEANITALEARINSAKAELEDATINKNRTEKLVSQNVLSQAELDQAVARFRKAVADVDSAKANLTLAKAQAEKAAIDLSYTFIKAPFDGTVLTKNADVGEIVAPFGSSTDARAAVVTIADMSSLEVEADVSEANISRIKVGQKCEIVLDSYPEKKYQGVINRVVPTVDRAKATVLTKIKFLDLDEHVLPEMSAKVAFLEARAR